MAALNFPDTPVTGDTYSIYSFDGTKWDGANPIYIDDFGNTSLSAPANKNVIKYNSQTAKFETSSMTIIPAGVVIPFAGSVVPDGYLVADGSVRIRANYPDLFSAIGTTFNTGTETSLQFRLPNLTGITPVGYDSTQTDFNAVGKYGGEKYHKLTVDEMATHTHTQNAHSHSQNGHSHTQDSHSHGATAPFNAGTWEIGSIGYPGSGSFRDRVGVTGGWGLGTDGQTPGIQNTVATNQNTTAINEYAGGDEVHNNIQPYITVLYLIKY